MIFTLLSWCVVNIYLPVLLVAVLGINVILLMARFGDNKNPPKLKDYIIVHVMLVSWPVLLPSAYRLVKSVMHEVTSSQMNVPLSR
jgi:hypothetical protein